MSPEQISVLIQLGQTISTVSALLFFILAFYRGEIIAKPVLDKILQQYENRITELSTSIQESINKMERSLVNINEDRRKRDENITRALDLVADRLGERRTRR